MLSNKILSINHISIHVKDVELSKAFYKNILLLKEKERPAFDFPGAWFEVGENQELHLIGNLTQAVISGSRSNHFAFEVENLKDWENHFNQQKAIFRPAKKRSDGAWQIFIEDPDGYWIELFSIFYE